MNLLFIIFMKATFVTRFIHYWFMPYTENYTIGNLLLVKCLWLPLTTFNISKYSRHISNFKLKKAFTTRLLSHKVISNFSFTYRLISCNDQCWCKFNAFFFGFEGGLKIMVLLRSSTKYYTAVIVHNIQPYLSTS